MSHKESGWQPTGRGMKYKDHEVWCYESGPHEINDGQIDPDDPELDDE